MNALHTLESIRKATLAARQRKGDESIATRAADGLVQVVRVTYEYPPNGCPAIAIVRPIGNYVQPSTAVDELNAL